MAGAWERRVPAGDRDPESRREIPETRRLPEIETHMQMQRETERPERPGAREAETSKEPERRAQKLLRPGKNVKYRDRDAKRYSAQKNCDKKAETPVLGKRMGALERTGGKTESEAEKWKEEQGN